MARAERFTTEMINQLWISVVVSTGLLIGAAGPAAAAVVKSPHVTAELIAEAGSVKPGADAWIGVRLVLEKHWHVYWRNPGDSGLPVSVAWKVPDGYAVGDLVWPAPDRLEEGPLVSFGHSGTVLLMAPLRVPAGAKGPVAIKATAKWLVCKDTCIPGSAEVSLSLPVGDGRPGPRAREFSLAAKHQPAAMPPGWTVAATASGRTLTLLLAGAAVPATAFFFPVMSDLIDHAAPQPVTRGKDGIRIALPLSDRVSAVPAVVEGVLRSGDRAWTLSVPATGAVGADGGASTTRRAAPGGIAGFLWAALLAFLGGMILNLMPCVFPVLSIKILGFVRESESHPREVRLHGLLYGAGVVVSFWALAAALFALKAGGERLGWGFQLQSPAVIFLLTVTLFFLSLNLLGVFEAGTTLARAAGGAKWGEGRSAAFFTGVLATFLATPCTAPFMGTAVGYAAVQPAHIGLGVFTALALGMAAPYVILSYVPHLGAMLPRPGRWMETFKHAMAFPLLATVIWLLWVLGLQAGLKIVVATLGSLLLIAIAGWVYGRWRSGLTRAITGALITGAVAFTLVVMRGAGPDAAKSAGGWAPWSEKAVAEARAVGRPVFVDFTAAWCLTCKVNEAVALHTDDVRKAFAAKGVVLLKADWTNPDPAIERALAAFERNGVPLYVLYPADPAAPPKLLPQILTPGMVLAELDTLPAGN